MAKVDDVLENFSTWCLCGKGECIHSDNYKKGKQALYTDLLELIDIPVYEMTENPNKEYEAGYNEMVIATRILLLQIRSGLADYFGVE